MSFVLSALKDNKDHSFLALLFGLVIVGGAYCFPHSYLLHSNVLIGMLLVPFTIFVAGKPRNNYLYLLCVLLFGVLALLHSLRIAYFFALTFFILWLVEYMIGRCNPLILFLLAFMSPIFTQVTTILGFPIRLYLSTISGSMLNMVGLDVQVEGNIIVMDGSAFSVDEACMGLNMLAMSMLIGVLVLGYRYRVSRKQSGLFQLVIFFVIVFVLNLITNLCRIVMLVFFRITPENSLHEVIGLLCFVFYTIIPIYFLSAGMIRHGHPITKERAGLSPLGPIQRMGLMCLAIGVLITGLKVNSQKAVGTTAHADVSYPYGIAQNLDDGITKISTNELLIYVKPIPEFFTGEHTPLMCWNGSGYVFSGIKESVVDGNRIYSGKLVKQHEELYTAWWYSNGKVATISQLEWRMRMFRGDDKFCLVNITAKDEETLLRDVSWIFRNNTLSVQCR